MWFKSSTLAGIGERTQTVVTSRRSTDIRVRSTPVNDTVQPLTLYTIDSLPEVGAGGAAVEQIQTKLVGAGGQNTYVSGSFTVHNFTNEGTQIFTLTEVPK